MQNGIPLKELLARIDLVLKAEVAIMKAQREKEDDIRGLTILIVATMIAVMALWIKVLI